MTDQSGGPHTTNADPILGLMRMLENAACAPKDILAFTVERIDTHPPFRVGSACVTQSKERRFPLHNFKNSLISMSVDFNRTDVFMFMMDHVPACRNFVAGAEAIKYCILLDDNNELAAVPEATPLILACLRGNVDVFNYIVDRHPDELSRSMWNYTPLMAATRCGRFSIIRLMEKHGLATPEHIEAASLVVHNIVQLAVIAACDDIQTLPVLEWILDNGGRVHLREGVGLKHASPLASCSSQYGGLNISKGRDKIYSLLVDNGATLSWDDSKDTAASRNEGRVHGDPLPPVINYTSGDYLYFHGECEYYLDREWIRKYFVLQSINQLAYVYNNGGCTSGNNILSNVRRDVANVGRADCPFLSLLPDELLVNVMRFLDVRSVAACASTCSTLRRLALDRDVQAHVIRRSMMLGDCVGVDRIRAHVIRIGTVPGYQAILSASRLWNLRDRLGIHHPRVIRWFLHGNPVFTERDLTTGKARLACTQEFAAHLPVPKIADKLVFVEPASLERYNSKGHPYWFSLPSTHKPLDPAKCVPFEPIDNDGEARRV